MRREETVVRRVLLDWRPVLKGGPSLGRTGRGRVGGDLAQAPAARWKNRAFSLRSPGEDAKFRCLEGL